MILGIELLNILLWLAIGLISAILLPIIIAFTDMMLMNFKDFYSIRNFLFTLAGAVIGPIIYKFIAGSAYTNYSTEGFFACILGIALFSLWNFIYSKQQAAD